MRFVRSSVCAITALFVASCGDVRSLDETREQFLTHRTAFEALAARVQLCGVSTIDVEDLRDAACAGEEVTRAEIVSEMRRLGLKSALRSGDGNRVEFVNGTDGTGSVGVMSSIVHYTSPQSQNVEVAALTPPPHHWFYAQHD